MSYEEITDTISISKSASSLDYHIIMDQGVSNDSLLSTAHAPGLDIVRMLQDYLQLRFSSPLLVTLTNQNVFWWRYLYLREQEEEEEGEEEKDNNKRTTKGTGTYFIHCHSQVILCWFLVTMKNMQLHLKKCNALTPHHQATPTVLSSVPLKPYKQVISEETKWVEPTTKRENVKVTCLSISNFHPYTYTRVVDEVESMKVSSW